VEAIETGVLVWPVRFDLCELGADTGKPWTLYHYTHKTSFDRFVKSLTEVNAAINTSQLARLVLDRLLDDFKERDGSVMQQDNKGDVELCIGEPAEFSSKEDIRSIIFKGAERTGYSIYATPWEEFAGGHLPVLAGCKVMGLPW